MFISDEEYRNYDLVVATTLDKLLKEKMIVKEEAERFLDEFKVVVINKKWYHRLFNKLTNKKEGEARFTFADNPFKEKDKEKDFEENQNSAQLVEESSN